MILEKTRLLQLPESCQACPEIYCQLPGKTTIRPVYMKRRHKSCPLIEVPDALIEQLEERKRTGMENKQEILDKLLATLQATRIFRDLASLEYEPEQEMVTAVYEGGATLRVNVAGDSGFAMIKDVLRLLA